jgi:hypothetical protein
MWKVGIGIGAIAVFLLSQSVDADARAGAGARTGGAHFGGARSVGFRGGGVPRGGVFRGGMGARSFGRPAFHGGMRSFSRPAYRGGFSRRAVTSNRAFRGNRAFVGQRAFRGNRAIASQRALRGDRAAFRANRALSRQAAFHRFHGRRFIGSFASVAWFGPLFWPYAYNDLFYYTFWPYWYDDPFWDYGYSAIYDGIFSPYGYGYASSPRYYGPRRQISRRSGITDDRANDITGSIPSSVGKACAAESRDVTTWPIDRIQRAVAPNEQQRALLDDLANASIKASEAIRAACPTETTLTPTGRLDVMEKRVEAMLKAIEIVREPLEKFYNSLSDEQKARFNALGEPARREARAVQRSAVAACAADTPGVTSWPTEQIERVLHPNDDQRAKLNELAAAAKKAAEDIQAACPRETPQTPVARLDAAAKRLQALQQAIKNVRTALGNFYSSLDDEQKARFNRIGEQLGRRPA